MGSAFKQTAVLALFLGLALIMTYPALYKLTNAVVGDHVDSLLNTWILAWDIHKITSGQIGDLFNANIFYPYKNTLAYSEHMLGNALIGLPIGLISKNPILVFNLVFIISLVLSAFGMYLLALHLTQNRYAAFCSGLIFAFFPWRFGHTAHLQLQSAQWIPLTLLYLHRFLEGGKYRHLFLFSGFFIWNFFSCGYYGMFLSLFVFLLILMKIIEGRVLTTSLLFKLGCFGAITLIFILPVYYPYIKLRQEVGFTRPIGEAIYFSADMLSYLSVPRDNRLWGRLPQIFGKPEGGLFIGLIPILLGIIGLISTCWRRPIPGWGHFRVPLGRKLRTTAIYLINALFILYLIVVVLIGTSGGVSFELFGVKVSATSLHNPLWILFFLGCLRLLLDYRLRETLSLLLPSFKSIEPRFYFYVLLGAFSLSLGPLIHLNGREITYGPYLLLYKYVPGFDGLRVPARFIILIALAVSVFAGYGMAQWLNSLNRYWKKGLLTLIVSFLILFEYASFPVFMPSIPTGKDVPEVYKWLAGQKGDFAILELPMPREADGVWREAKYVYFSTYHWKKLVNGYSGYFPPGYNDLYLKGMKNFPSPNSIHVIKGLGIKYLIIHYANFGAGEKEKIRASLNQFRTTIKPARQFAEDTVYEMAPEIR